ncbi:hypothetical protein ACF0H5_010703 [Mactra antiquata]
MYYFILSFFIGTSVCQSETLFENASHVSYLKDANSSFYHQFHRNYQENYKQAMKLNSGTSKNGAKNGITKFSHLSFEEFRELYLSDLQSSVKPVNQSRITSLNKLKQLNIPQKLDWRTNLGYNIISPIKNQNKCGGCWAFSTVETVESMYSKGTGQQPLDLSVQQVIDCTSGAFGCSGGDTCNALKWMVHSKTPIVTNAQYPLKDESNFCKMILNTTYGVRVKDYTCHRQIAEDRMLQLLQEGPLVAAVDATTWNNYQGGIIQYHCENLINHAVQIIGYDLTGEVPYYIVRNSWGTDFGHDGYIYIKIGENVCGIASEISTVSVYV